jgi:hypothetical protein
MQQVAKNKKSEVSSYAMSNATELMLGEYIH